MDTSPLNQNWNDNSPAAKRLREFNFEEIPKDTMDELFSNRSLYQAPEQQAAIELTGEELTKFKRDFFDELRSTVAGKGLKDEFIKQIREIYEMRPGPKPYPNAPNFTMPELRAKVNGYVAAVRGELNKEMMFVAKPYTSEAARSRPVWESAMEREIVLSGGRRQINLAVLEQGITGTGVIGLSLAKKGKHLIIQEKAVRLDDFYMTPLGLDNLEHASTFVRFIKPFHLLLQDVKEGYYDEDSFKSAAWTNILTTQTNEQLRGLVTQGWTNLSDNTPVELFESYYRYNGTCYYVEARLETETILRLVKSPYREAIGDRPPYVGLRGILQPGIFYGESFASILMGVQGAMDWAMNSMLAYYQSNLTPAEIIDETAEVSRRESKSSSVYPGAKIKVRGDPNTVMRFVQAPVPTNAEQLIAIMRQIGNEATINDYPLGGGMMNTARSATEHNILAQTAQSRMSESIDNISEDLTELANLKWAMFSQFKVKGEGIYEIYGEDSSQYLLAPEEIGEEEIFNDFMQFGEMEGKLPPGFAMAFSQDPMMQSQLKPLMPQFFIAGTNRTDLVWEPQGKSTSLTMARRAQTFEALMSKGAYIEAAYQLSSYWKMMKGYMEALGIQNWKDYLPQEPPDDSMMTPEQKLAILSQIAEQTKFTRQGGSPYGQY